LGQNIGGDLEAAIEITEEPGLSFFFEAFRELAGDRACNNGRCPWGTLRDYGHEHGFASGAELDDFISLMRQMETAEAKGAEQRRTNDQAANEAKG